MNQYARCEREECRVMCDIEDQAFLGTMIVIAFKCKKHGPQNRIYEIFNVTQCKQDELKDHIMENTNTGVIHKYSQLFGSNEK